MSELEAMTSQVKFLESELDQSNLRDSDDKQAVGASDPCFLIPAS